MAPRRQEKPKVNPDRRPGIGPWGDSHATYIAGESYLLEADKAAQEVERRWGSGRARLLVDAELRAKFDSQRLKLNKAIWHGQLEEVRVEAERMVKAWRAVDRACEALQAAPLTPAVWESVLDDGVVLRLYRSDADLRADVEQRAWGGVVDGRAIQLWSLDEVARLISARVFEQSVKAAFPGVTVEAVRPPGDVLGTIPDDGDPLPKALVEGPIVLAQATQKAEPPKLRVVESYEDGF